MRRLLWLLLILPFLAPIARGQAEIPHFASDPPTCDPTRGLLYYNTTTQQVKSCTALNIWTYTGASPAVGRIVTGTTDTPTSADCTLQPINYRNTSGGGVTATINTAPVLGNSACNMILRNQTIPGAPLLLNFTTWLAISPFCAPPSSSPCSSLQLGQNQEVIITVDPAGGAWNVQPSGMVNGANVSAQVAVTCAPSASLPFSPLPQVFVTDFFIQLTQNCTITGVTGPFTQGSEIVITTINNGGFTLGFPANFLNTPPIQTGVNAYNAMAFQYCGTAGTVACPAGDWNNTDIGPAGALPTLDAVLNPINNASFTFPLSGNVPTVMSLTGTAPASAATGQNGGALLTLNLANGGAASAGSGGDSQSFVVNEGTGGASTSGNLNSSFRGIVASCGANGTGGINFATGQAENDCMQANTSIAANGIFPFSPNLGVFARNKASTASNTVNNASGSLGLSAHMMLGGTASVTNGSPNVAQVSGSFFGMTLPGRTITIHGANYTVLSITNNNNLVLTANYTTDPGTTTQSFIEDAVVTCGFVMSPSLPGQSGQTPQNSVNPDISMIMECPSLNYTGANYPGTLHLVFEEGGGVIDTLPGGGSIGGSASFYSVGGYTLYGANISNTTQGSTYLLFQTFSSVATGHLNLNYAPSYGAGAGINPTPVAAAGDDNKNNGTWVYTQEMVNASGSTINDGSPVKMSGTANQITPTVTTDTGANIVIGVNIGSCTAGSTCHIAWGGRLIGVMKMGTASCAIGNAVIVDTTTNQDIKCIAAGSATFGTVIGMAESAQATPGNTVDVSIRIH